MGLKYFSVNSVVELCPIFQENIPALLKKKSPNADIWQKLSNNIWPYILLKPKHFF